MRFTISLANAGLIFLYALASRSYAPDNGEDNCMRWLAMAATLLSRHAKNSNHLRQNL